jgi:hypothetical protein
MMRNPMMAMMAIFLATALHAATPPADVGAGRIAWFDITTTSLAKSKDFYGEIQLYAVTEFDEFCEHVGREGNQFPLVPSAEFVGAWRF